MMANDLNRSSSSNANKPFKSRGVYDMLEKVNIPEYPSWRDASNSSTSTSTMLKKIVENLDNSTENTQQRQEKLHQLKLKYVLNSNCGENEGTQTMDGTKIAMNKKDNENIFFEEQVSRNLMAAINHLKKLNSGEDRGLLDIEECIQDTHKVLMKNLLKQNKRGTFSTEKRVAADDGHVYPKFDTEDEAYNAIQRIVDDYNATIDYIKESHLDPIKQNTMYIGCAAYILYNFVNLHPFSDGNGRMCRLLASHCLYLVFPFPCPIYNIYAPTKRDDYIDGIKKARRHNGEKLGDLVALLIESGWHTAEYLNSSD